MKPSRFTLACIVVALLWGAPMPSLSVAENGELHGPGALSVIQPLEVPGIHNLFALGTNVFSGGAPEGDQGFAALAELGVKTIITVDGAKPDVGTAHKYGMRYVHMPHGYDGISADVQLMLAKAGRELEGPVFVHCHHGEHRGPAAAAVICMADQGWSHEQAEAFLVLAGTSTNYAGLYETVRKFEMPSDEALRALPDSFPEIARVSGLVDAMVEIDERWENLKEVRAAGYRAPPDHPDMDPVNETVILWEQYREAQRLPEVSEHGADMMKSFAEAETAAGEAGWLLRLFVGAPSPELATQLDKSFDVMGENCAACHKVHRNPAGIKSRQ